MEYKVCILINVLGIGMCSWVILICGSGLIQLLWRWIDDGEYNIDNWVIEITLRLLGYKRENEIWKYYKYDRDGKVIGKSDGDIGYLVSFMWISLFPPFIYFTICFPIFASTSIVLILIIYLTRFTRRIHKKLNSHIENH